MGGIDNTTKCATHNRTLQLAAYKNTVIWNESVVYLDNVMIETNFWKGLSLRMNPINIQNIYNTFLINT